jgi:O-antigen/teichoic acid export membrane protein
MTNAAKHDDPLDHSLVAGMAWTAGLRWPAHAISWIATAYAARLLTPGDYGIISMAMIAIGMVRMVEDFGLDSVLLQDRTIVGIRQAQLAGFVLMAGVGLAGLFMLLSHPIAAFFGEPQVGPVIMLLSLLCVADALQVVPRAALQRQMQFARLAWAQFLQIAVTQGVLVIGASRGWGVWALVFNTLAGSAFVTVLLLYWHPYPVRWPRDIATLARPLLQGWRILASRAAYYAYSNADQTVVGRVLGKDALGAYSFATTLSTTLSQEISSVVSRVVPGIFTAVQDKPAELRRYFLVLTEMVSYLTLPISVGLALTADYAVLIVLGPQWQAVIVPLRLLCIYAACYTSQLLIGPVLMWTGQFRANMWCSILAGVVLPIAFIAGTHWRLEGVALAWSLVFPIVNLPAMVIAFRTMDIGFGAWFSALLPAAASCVGLSAALLAARWALPADISIGMAATATVSAGAAGFLLTLGLVFRRRALQIFDFLRALRTQRLTAPAAPAAMGA